MNKLCSTFFFFFFNLEGLENICVTWQNIRGSLLDSLAWKNVLQKSLTHSLCLSRCPPPHQWFPQWVPQWVIAPLPLVSSVSMVTKQGCCMFWERLNFQQPIRFKKSYFVQPLVSKGHILWPQTSCNFSCLKRCICSHSVAIECLTLLHCIPGFFCMCIWNLARKREIFVFVCLQAAARELKLQPWASEQPSFFTELLRFTQFITTTEVHKLTKMLPGSIIVVLRNNLQVVCYKNGLQKARYLDFSCHILQVNCSVVQDSDGNQSKRSPGQSDVLCINHWKGKRGCVAYSFR